MKSKAASKARSKRSKSKRDISAPSSLVVGVGASAGGLEALRAMISNVKDLSGTSLVVVQHLSPQHRSMLVDLISRETSIAVKEVEDGATPQPNTIYITPPNANIVFRDGALRLAAPTGIGPKPSVNLFLESLAEELGERAAAVILSGTGTDGARGMAAIKAAGGITLAQSASTAK